MFAKEWPPIPGNLFETRIMCWSYKDESFWRGRSVAMAEVISYAKSMALTRFKEAQNEGSPPPQRRGRVPSFDVLKTLKT
jgi:hypothetical protein